MHSPPRITVQSTITAQWGETTVVGWLHRATPHNNTLVVLIHGHNSMGSEGRFIELAKLFESKGVDCLRFNVTRQKLSENEFLVTTVGEEIAQAKALMQKLRPQYEHIVAIGHSQGGTISLYLALDGLVDGVVYLMGAFDMTMHATNKLHRMGVTEAVLAKGLTITNYDGRLLHYTKAFLDDYVSWTPLEVIGNWYGPSLFILGTLDKTVQEPELRNAFERAQEPKEFRTLESDHRFTNAHALPIVETVLPWMEKNELFFSPQ